MEAGVPHQSSPCTKARCSDEGKPFSNAANSIASIQGFCMIYHRNHQTTCDQLYEAHKYLTVLASELHWGRNPMEQTNAPKVPTAMALTKIGDRINASRPRSSISFKLRHANICFVHVFWLGKSLAKWQSWYIKDYQGKQPELVTTITCYPLLLLFT